MICILDITETEALVFSFSARYFGQFLFKWPFSLQKKHSALALGPGLSLLGVRDDPIPLDLPFFLDPDFFFLN
jgi:hypothetical protein